MLLFGDRAEATHSLHLRAQFDDLKLEFKPRTSAASSEPFQAPGIINVANNSKLLIAVIIFFLVP